MMAVMLAGAFAEFQAAVVGASDSDGGPVWLLALGPVAAVALYFLFWRYYRNTHQSHSFERETRIAAQPVSGNDTKVDEVKGTQRTRINGDNRGDHRKRVQRIE